LNDLTIQYYTIYNEFTTKRLDANYAMKNNKSNNAGKRYKL